MQRQMLFCHCISFPLITEYGVNTLQIHIYELEPLLSTKSCGHSKKLKIKQSGFIEPVKFFVNIDVRFVEEDFKRGRISKRYTQDLEGIVD